VPGGGPDGGQWTGGEGTDGGSDENIFSVLFDPRRAIIQRGIEAALALFGGLSGSNGQGGQAVIAFNAREFRVGEGGESATALVGRLTEDEVDRFCPRFGDVQLRTDETYARIARERPFASATQLGTAVHVSLKDQIQGLADTDYRAEISRLKTRDADYGFPGSIRIDALERSGLDTTCVYDIKTGNAGLSLPRMVEIAKTAANVFPGTTRLIVTEVRPRR
jgi:hypothetical protein